MSRKKDMSQKKALVEEILRRNPAARVNYIELYVEYLKETGGSLNLADHISDRFNLFESLSRARRKVLEDNPFLKDKDFATSEQQMREWAREEI